MAQERSQKGMKVSEEREERGKERAILNNTMTYCSYDKFTSNKIKSINALEVERERRMSLTSIILKKKTWSVYINIYINTRQCRCQSRKYH